MKVKTIISPHFKSVVERLTVALVFLFIGISSAAQAAALPESNSCDALFFAPVSNLLYTPEIWLTTPDWWLLKRDVTEQGLAEAAESWARPGYVYRGLTLTPSELKDILHEGLIVEKSSYDLIYSSRHPADAAYFMIKSRKTNPSHKINLILEMREAQIPQLKDGDRYLTSRFVPPYAIVRIFIVDRNNPVSHPFSEFSRQDLEQIFSEAEN